MVPIKQGSVVSERLYLLKSPLSTVEARYFDTSKRISMYASNSNAGNTAASAKINDNLYFLFYINFYETSSETDSFSHGFSIYGYNPTKERFYRIDSVALALRKLEISSWVTQMRAVSCQGAHKSRFVPSSSRFTTRKCTRTIAYELTDDLSPPLTGSMARINRRIE